MHLPRLLLVTNPQASRASSELQDRVIAAVNRRYAVEVAASDSAAQSTEASRQAAEQGVAVVAALGGDGTARSVAEGIAGADAALACLPAGSRNVFARMLSLPEDPIDAAEALGAGALRERRVDLGVVAGHRFLFAASVGLSARVNEQLNRHPRLKARLGAAYGAGAAVGAALSYLVRPPRMRLSADGSRVEAVSLIVQNARPLTYVGQRPLELCQHVSLDSATVSIAALRRLRPADLVGLPGRLLLHSTEPPTAHRHVEELGGVARVGVAAVGTRELPVDLDGDHLGSLDALEVGVAPGALRVLAGTPASQA